MRKSHSVVFTLHVVSTLQNPTFANFTFHVANLFLLFLQIKRSKVAQVIKGSLAE